MSVHLTILGSGSGGNCAYLETPECRLLIDAGFSGRQIRRRLATIAQFFQRTEPHSPVAYLVQRAVRWGEMPLENWLDEVIPDPNVLNALRETLGLPKKSEY